MQITWFVESAKIEIGIGKKNGSQISTARSKFMEYYRKYPLLDKKINSKNI